LAGTFACASAGACLILLFMPLPLWIGLPLCMMAAVSGYYHVMDALLRLPWSLIAFELNGKGELHVLRRDGSRHHAQILPTSVVTPSLTLLNFKVGDTVWRRHMLITPDRVDAEAFRRLRVWLRWSRQAISDTDAAEAA
jgi:toxin CptA